MSDDHYLDEYLSQILPALGLDAETYAPYVTGFVSSIFFNYSWDSLCTNLEFAHLTWLPMHWLHALSSGRWGRRWWRRPWRFNWVIISILWNSCRRWGCVGKFPKGNCTETGGFYIGRVCSKGKIIYQSICYTWHDASVNVLFLFLCRLW